MVLKRSLQTDLIFTRLLPSNYSRIFVGCSSQSTCTFVQGAVLHVSLFNLQGTRPNLSNFGFSWAPHFSGISFYHAFFALSRTFLFFFQLISFKTALRSALSYISRSFLYCQALFLNSFIFLLSLFYQLYFSLADYV